MKKYLIIFWVSLLWSLGFSQITGKRPTAYGFDMNVKPSIYYDVYITFNNQNYQPQINILFKVQNDLLYFTKSENGYEGGYDISMAVKEPNSNSTVLSQVWKEKVFVKEFELTNSKELYQVNAKVFETDLSTGEYEVYLELTDKESRNTFTSKRKLIIPDLHSSIYYSDIKLLSPQDNLSAEIMLEDEKSTVEFNNNLLVQFEIIRSNHTPMTLTSILYQEEEEKKTELRRKEYTLSDENQFTRFNELLERKILDEGDYLLEYKLQTAEKAYIIQKKFSVIWYSKPLYLYDVDLAVPPLQYILPPDEWKKLDDLSDEERSKWLRTYWKARDPDPDTPLNEIMVEFYKRVLEANEKYAGQYTEGWKTDRGKTLILYGKPDKIEVHRYQLNSKPYEIWYYHAEHKKFIFMDVDEDETYPLVSVEDIGDNSNE